MKDKMIKSVRDEFQVSRNIMKKDYQHTVNNFSYNFRDGWKLLMDINEGTMGYDDLFWTANKGGLYQGGFKTPFALELPIH